MPELAGVDLEDSWVLGWRYDAPAGRLTVEVEANLWRAPGDERGGGRAHLLSPGDARVRGRHFGVRAPAAGGGPGAPGSDGTRDYGSVDVLEGGDGVFRLAGEMGDVTLRAAALRLRVDGAVPPAP